MILKSLDKKTHIVCRVVLPVCFVFAAFFGFASVNGGFKALGMYDYFLAKKQFYRLNKKHPNACASYGLAIIYSRADNPFYNLDSAAKYAALSYCTYRVKPVKMQLSGFAIDSLSILALCDTVAFKQWHKVKKSGNIKVFNSFLRANYLANGLLKEQAVYLRDELEYNEMILQNRSDSTDGFINTHPQSAFLQEALLLQQRQVYEEQTAGGTVSRYKAFIARNPANLMLNTAYENLYNLYKQASDVSGLKDFVSVYPGAPQHTEAWKLLFSLSVKSFSNEELEKFLLEYPAFPFKTSILKELELNKVQLFPYQKVDLFGFIDSLAKPVIPMQYDAVSAFSEGLSVVNRNDTVFYINKENINPFNQYYSEAYPFKNGIAAARQGSKWGFINRQGQLISGNYEEVNELSNQVYVVKLNNKYGAIDHLGQTIIEPRFQKLGDFKNGFAYYIEDSKYGFISKAGYVHKASFDWISDFNESSLAIVKQDNLYGLVNSQGNVMLAPENDLLVRAAKNTFIVVKNGLYGFFSGTGCYITPVVYDYLKEKPAEFYTNGTVFKLLKKNEQALMDANGRLSIDFGAYDEVNFASGGLIRVKRKNKYGFADRKLNLVIPYKYQQAQDFSDSLAVVQQNDKTLLINSQGKEVYAGENGLEKLSKHYYVTDGDRKEIINARGEKLLSDVLNIQKQGPGLFIVTLSNNAIKLLRD